MVTIVIHAFYKGTSFAWQMNQEIYPKTRKEWEIQVDECLQRGDTEDELKTHYLETLGIMEKIWFDSQQLFGSDLDTRTVYMINECNKHAILGERKTSIEDIVNAWFTGVASLLKLKGIENDDMNGFAEEKLSGNFQIVNLSA
jgi:hypothetical protein